MLKMNIPNIARTNIFNAELSSAPTAGDIYTLTIKDVKGENLIVGPAEGAAIISTWEFAVDLPVDMNSANTKRTTGRARFQEMSFTKDIDATTPVLYTACAKGTSLGEAVLQVGRGSGDAYVPVMTITLGEPIISQMSTGGYGDGKVPMDTFTINFTTVKISYVAQKLDGGKGGETSFGWDLTTNVSA